ncbi:Uncharacterised protein [Klebsiella pneumoniae subsp. ozaenae]|uniref:Uncharacterized protein n=1 Tax=Klebsiella pneumoniae subsp. ozaenae TaxID=574 RepID=A0A377Z1Y0_KLEPO|nr:Uncharacterised protein [Klebsiella pneumoniae subsp. ozaenae]
MSALISTLLRRLGELITNPATGRLSTSDTMVLGAFLVASFVIVWVTVTGHLEEWHLGRLPGRVRFPVSGVEIRRYQARQGQAGGGRCR